MVPITTCPGHDIWNALIKMNGLSHGSTYRFGDSLFIYFKNYLVLQNICKQRSMKIRMIKRWVRGNIREWLQSRWAENQWLSAGDQPPARGWSWRAKLKASALRGSGHLGRMNTSGSSCALIVQARRGWVRKWDYTDSVPPSACGGLPPKRRVNEGEEAKAVLEVTVSALRVPARMASCSGVTASVSFPYVVLIQSYGTFIQLR